MILAVARGAARYADLIKAQHAEVIVSPGVGSEPAQSTNPDNRIPDGVFQDQKSNWNAQASNIGDIEAAGIPYAITSNGSVPDFFADLRTAINHGATRNGVIAGLTTNPARILGLGKGYGSIAVGNPANLTILSADITNPKCSVSMVVVNGSLYKVENQ